MRKQQKGSVTIVLALAVVCFLSFCLVLLEGVRLYCYRVKAAQAMDLAEFSVLSEYQYELFSHYGVLFLDLDYELGKEYTAVLEQRISKYLEKKKNEVIYYNNVDEAELKSSADSLEESLQEENKK